MTFCREDFSLPVNNDAMEQVSETVPLFLFFYFFYLFIYPEESCYIVNGLRLSPAVGLAFP